MPKRSTYCAAFPGGQFLGIVGAIAFGFLYFTTASASADGETAATPSLEGTWVGQLKSDKGELRGIFHISKNAKGYTGVMDSPDQGVFGINCNLVTMKDGNVELALSAIGAKYTGKISSDGKEITGHWEQPKLRAPLNLTRTQVSLVPQGIVFAYWAAILCLSALFLRLACSLCKTNTPSWTRSIISVLLVALLAYLTADFTAYLIMRSMQGVVLQVPPWYSFQFWIREPIALKWNIISHGGPLKYLPFVFALCVAGTLQVFILQAQVTFRVGLAIILMQWGTTILAGYIVALVLGVALQGATMPETPLTHASEAGEKSDATSLQVVQRQVGDAAQESREFAEKAWENLTEYADPYLEDLKNELEPATKHLPQPVQDFLNNGGWWAILGVLVFIALLWLRSLMRRLYGALPQKRAKKKKRRAKVGVSLKEDLALIGEAKTEEGPDRVTIRGLPARLRLVVMALGTRGGRELSEGMADRVLDWIKPGLAEVTAADYPAVRVWPPFFGASGFATAFNHNVVIPEPQGSQSHWILLIGQVTIGKSILHVGLAFYADDENTVRNIKANDQWLSVIGVTAATATV